MTGSPSASAPEPLSVSPLPSSTAYGPPAFALGAVLATVVNCVAAL